VDGFLVGFDNSNIVTIWPESAVVDRAIPPCTIPAGRSRFAHFFEPMLPLMNELHWLALGGDSSPFVDLIYEPGGEELLDSYYIDHPRFDNTSASLFRPGVLPALADWLRDDWINLLGFVADPSTAGEIADRLFDAWDASNRGNEKYYSAIERTMELCLFCVDGFSWEAYGKDQAAVARALERLRQIEGVILSERQLRERDAWFGFS
jgi:hypothetical protein